MVICPDCGKEVPKNKFCKNCGAYLADIEEPVEEVIDSPVEDSNDVLDVNSEENVDSEPAEEVIDSPVEDSNDVLDVNSEENVDSEPAEEVEVPVKIVSKSSDEAEKPGEEVQEEKTHSQKSQYCFNCGYKLPEDFHFCPNCGQDQTSRKITPKKATGEKSTLLAVILSVILPGLGQIYLGLDSKGAILLIAYVISAFLIIFMIGILLVAVIWIWALIDTVISANALERGEEVSDKLF